MRKKKVVLVNILYAVVSILAAIGLPTAYSQSDKGLLQTVDWSSDGRYILVTYQYSADILNATQPSSVITSIPLKGSVSSVAWSPDANYVALNNGWLSIDVFDLTTSQFIQELPGNEYLADVDWSPEGNLLAYHNQVYSGDLAQHYIEIWDTATWQLSSSTLVSEMDNPVTSLEWSPDGQFIATGGVHNNATIWDATTVTVSRELAVDPGGSDQLPNTITSVSWCSNVQLATGGEDGVVRVWNITTGQQEKQFLLTTEAYIHGEVIVDCDPNGNFLVVISSQGFQIWEMATSSIIYSIPYNSADRIVDASWSPDGTQLSYGSTSGNINIIPLPTNPSKELLQAKVNECIPDRGLHTSLTAKINAEQWQAFINEVNAQRGKKISEDCAVELIEMAEYLRDNP